MPTDNKLKKKDYFEKEPRIRNLTQCDLCKIGVGISEYFGSIVIDDTYKKAWCKHTHQEQRLFDWNKTPIIKRELVEFGNENVGYRYSQKKVIYRPKKLCGSCFKKYKHLLKEI